MSNRLEPQTMKPESKRGFKPKLRFPEFQGEPEWNTEKLGTVASLITERAGNKKCIPMSITSGVGLVSQQEKFGRTIAGNQYENYLVLQKNDFAYNKSATKEFPQGFIAKYSGDEPAAVPNSIFTCFRANKDGVVPDFLNYLFLGNHHGRWLRKYIEISARAHGSLSVGDDDLMSLPVPLPRGEWSRAEQQKIAECLTSLDKLIAAHGKKLDALGAFKEGLMQRLFPQPGGTAPRLRFPEFQNGGEWKEMSIQDMIDQRLILGHLDGNHGELYPRSEEFTQDKDGIPYISANDFVNGAVNFSKCKRLPIQRARLFKKGVAKDGDILFAHNATVGPVAKLNTAAEFVILSTTATYFRCNVALLLNDFLKFSLASPTFVGQYSSVMSQSTRNQVPITTQRKLKLFTTSFLEQQRIASCLSALDDLIVGQTQKLDALKTHKQGLV